MNRRRRPLALLLALVALATLAGCASPSSSSSSSGSSGTSASRSSSAPRVRCLTDPSRDDQSSSRPLFFLFCAESP
jgi:hypothetical protein